MEPTSQTVSIASYLIQYVVTGSSDTKNISNSTNYVILTDLSPFTNYTITVMAIGDDIMGTEAVVTVATLEGG